MKPAFALDPQTCYLDAASITPRPRVAGDAARDAVARSERPWVRRGVDKSRLAAQVRALAASALNAPPEQLALTGAVSYGMATAAANLRVPAGSRILALQDDHPSAALVWQQVAARSGAVFETVARPADHDWTRAVRDRLERGPAPSLAVLPPLHWVDGLVLDLAVLAPLVRARGAALVVDATQAAGVLEVDAPALDADFVAFPAYKWMLGPYGLAFLYAHPRHHGGQGLEEHMGTRRAPALQEAGPAGDFSHQPGALRFDRGERDDPIALATAQAGLALAGSVDRSAKRARLWALNERLCAALAPLGIAAAPRHLRAPHILGLGVGDRSAAAVAQALERRGVYVSARRGLLRVSPFLYNDEADIDRFAATLRDVLAA